MYHQKKPTQFYLSIEGKCPYLANQFERKIFTTLSPQNAQKFQNALTKRGFRRSQNIIYRPACLECGSCFSARIPVDQFSPSQSERRVLNKNLDIVREVRRNEATEEQYELFRRYVTTRHDGGGMSDMSLYEYQAMIEETDAPARVIEYRLLENGRPARLIGAVLADVLDDGLSMVYAFFDPDCAKRSLGRFFILDHVAICKERAMPKLYLGYWVKNSPNMGYKSNYRPLEVFMGGRWVNLAEVTLLDDRPKETRAILADAHQALQSEL